MEYVTAEVARSSLNEGRPGGAGNPARCGPYRRTLSHSAQRRPARWGRQPHQHSVILGRVLLGRSTKAGPVGPATLANAAPARAVGGIAQRRPARWGRQPCRRGEQNRCPDRLAAQRRPARWGRQPHHDGPMAIGILTAQRRPARWGRQPCPTSTIGALRHMGNIGERAKGVEKQRLHLRWASVLKDHSRFADRYRTHGSPNSCDRGRPSVVRDSWIGPAKR